MRQAMAATSQPSPTVLAQSHPQPIPAILQAVFEAFLYSGYGLLQLRNEDI